MVETCYSCGEEIRFGTRHGQLAWWHRDDVDHRPAHGKPVGRETYLQMLANHHSIGVDEATVESKVIEPIEVYSTPLTGDEPVVPSGARSLVKLARQHGWELVRFTYSRGPYMSGTGLKSLGVADFVVVSVRTTVDGARLGAVASYRNGKTDTCWVVRSNTATRSGIKALRDLIKETSHADA